MAGNTVFRINVGGGKLANGAYFDTGVQPGFPDLFGFDKQGYIFFIEVKNEKGRPRDDQKVFHRMLVDKHITHGIARSAEDALKIINEHLCGYGFKDYEQPHD